jgi:hypothetical protein
MRLRSMRIPEKRSEVALLARSIAPHRTYPKSYLRHSSGTSPDHRRDTSAKTCKFIWCRECGVTSSIASTGLTKICTLPQSEHEVAMSRARALLGLSGSQRRSILSASDATVPAMRHSSANWQILATESEYLSWIEICDHG